MTKVKAYAAPSEGAPLVATMVDRRDVGPDDVQFDVLFCGICHSEFTQCAVNGASKLIHYHPAMNLLEK